MWVRIDRNADAVYVNLTEVTIVESEQVTDGIIVDYDAEGRMVGVEILAASRENRVPSKS